MERMRRVWRNGGIKFVSGEKGSNTQKTQFRFRFVHHKTHMGCSKRELETPAVGGVIKPSIKITIFTIIQFVTISYFSFFFYYLSSTNVGLASPGPCNPNCPWVDDCRGSQTVGPKLGRITRSGLPESVASTMLGPLPETTQDRTQRTYIQSRDRD